MRLIASIFCVLFLGLPVIMGQSVLAEGANAGGMVGLQIPEPNAFLLVTIWAVGMLLLFRPRSQRRKRVQRADVWVWRNEENRRR
jgi:hypothetical protein